MSKDDVTQRIKLHETATLFTYIWWKLTRKSITWIDFIPRAWLFNMLCFCTGSCAPPPPPAADFSSRNNFRTSVWISSLHWRHNGRDSVSNHQSHDCLLNGLFRRRSKKTSKLRVTGLCAGNSPETGEFPAQIASNAEKVSIWWRHHVSLILGRINGPDL